MLRNILTTVAGLVIFGTSIFAQDSVTVFTKYYPASTGYSARKRSMKVHQLADSSFILIGNQGIGRDLYALHIDKDGTTLHFHVYRKPVELFRLHLTQWGDLYAFVGQPDGYIIRLKVDPAQGFDTIWLKQYSHLGSTLITFFEYGQALVEQDKIYIIGRVNSTVKPCVFVLDTLGNLLNVWMDLASPGAIEGSVVRHPDGDLVLAYRTETRRYAVVKISPDFQQVRWARLIQDEAIPYLLVDPQTGYIWVFSDGWGATLDILAFDANGNLKISKAYTGASYSAVVHKAFIYEDKIMVLSAMKAFILSRNDGSLIQAAYIGTTNPNDPISVSDVIFTLDSAFVFAANDARGKFTLVKTNRFL
ncbi:MAG: hypothetical protein GXO48_04945, partial [Chlorobi bacterium]|nr:hypothetical protein [Chlorobiota bacterium]